MDEVGTIRYRAELQASSTASGPLLRFALAGAGRLFLTDRARWHGRVARSMGISDYKPGNGAASAFLDELLLLDLAFVEDGISLDEVANREKLCSEVVRLTTKYGPLGPVKGVLEPSPLPPREAEFTTAAFDLDNWCLKASELARARRETDAEGDLTSRTELFERLLLESKEDLLEIELLPRMEDQAVVFLAQPLTMQALMWEVLFGALDSPARGFCQWCGEKIERTVSPGPKPRYCLAHRSSVYRMRVKAGGGQRFAVVPKNED